MYPLRFIKMEWVADLGVLVSMGLAVPVWAEPRQCDDSFFSVDAKEAELGSLVCQTLSQHRNRLEACGLRQHRVLTVEIVDRIDHPLGSCLAYFDCDYDLVRITTPEMYGELTAGDLVYSQFPEEVILRSLLAHELAHALIVQLAGARQIDMVDQEYIAGAMELELLDPEWRAVYLEAASSDAAPRLGLIDIWIYGFTPRKFAANAWHHFRQPEHGCDLVQEIVAGRKTFSKSVRPELR
ncbi:MAG: hypothetical protein QNI90_09940 [Dinoroseobacter sp.]|nr:hypothetical protein [Dinoroseobacter sp.]